MNDESFEQLEQQIAGAHSLGAPVELRAAVLGDMQRELRAARWDRWLARAAVVMLVVGVGLNAATMLPERLPSTRTLATASQQEALVQVAVSVAEATDMQIGRQVARQLAARTGQPLSVDDAAAVDAAIDRHKSHGRAIGKEG